MSDTAEVLGDQLISTGDWRAETPERWIDLRRVRLGESPRAVDLPTAIEQQISYEWYGEADHS